jgi:hypothetical protein
MDVFKPVPDCLYGLPQVSGGDYASQRLEAGRIHIRRGLGTRLLVIGNADANVRTLFFYLSWSPQCPWPTLENHLRKRIAMQDLSGHAFACSICLASPIRT